MIVDSLKFIRLSQSGRSMESYSVVTSRRLLSLELSFVPFKTDPITVFRF